MNKEKIIAKLDTYIKEYSKLLDVNSQLKSDLEKERQEKEVLIEKINKHTQIINNSTELVKKTIDNAELIISQMETYKENMIKIFDELDNMIELIFNKENFSDEDVDFLKNKIDNLKKRN